MECFLLIRTVPSKVAVIRNVMIRIVEGNSGTASVEVSDGVEVGEGEPMVQQNMHYQP